MEILPWATRGGPHVITGVLTGGPQEGHGRARHEVMMEAERQKAVSMRSRKPGSAGSL